MIRRNVDVGGDGDYTSQATELGMIELHLPMKRKIKIEYFLSVRVFVFSSGLSFSIPF